MPAEGVRAGCESLAAASEANNSHGFKVVELVGGGGGKGEAAGSDEEW